MSQNKRYITGKQIKDMLLGAYHSFEKNYQFINDLNVFPVPDGDTGTNMMHTMASVARELSAMSDDSTVGEIGLAAAKSAIMGARGNSGVILSQLLRGIGRGLAGKNLASNNELGKAFQYGVLFSYRSVSQPVEGTILTVARGIAKGAYTATRNCEGLEDIFNEAIRVGKLELAETPEKLPALKAAGVVDAGGQGLIAFLEGCLAGLRGEDCAEIKVTQKANVKMQADDEEPLDLEFPYCTEFIVKGANVDKKTVVSAIEGFGNSLIVAVVEDIVKVHIHSKNPGNVLNTAQQWGTLHDIKIENMVDQHENRIFSDDEEFMQTPVKRSGVGIIAVAAGDGVAKIMRDLGAAEIISGGQSMNPPVEDFVNAIENGEYEQYIILPNNKNIILAADQVKKMLGDSNVNYVSTANLAQGMAALFNFNPESSLEENYVVMSEAAKSVTSGAVTIAVRDSVVNGVQVHKGEYLGLINDKIFCTGLSVKAVLDKMLEDGDYELITLYYGEDITKDEAEEIVEHLGEINEDWEIELFHGGQPLYPLLMSME